MKIAILASYPMQRYAAELGVDPKAIKRVTTWNETLVDGLRQHDDLEILVVTGTPAVDEKKVVHDGNVTVVYLPIHKRRHKWSLFFYTRCIVKKILRDFNPDIVHGIGTEHIWPHIAVSSKYPHLITIHGLVSALNKQSPPKSFLSQMVFFGWLEKRLLPRIKNLIVINKYVSDAYGQNLNANIYYIENPIREAFRRINGVPEKGKHILYVGTVSSRKGIDILIEALGEIKNRAPEAVPLCKIVGPFSSQQFEAKLRERISVLGLDDRIDFLGFKLPEELVGLYGSAALLVLPSLGETAPMCIAESLSAGVPVVATDVGGVKYMVENGETGFIVPPSDADALGRALERLWCDGELREKMGENAKRAAAHRWSPEKIASQTLEAYRAVIGEKNS